MSSGPDFIIPLLLLSTIVIPFLALFPFCACQQKCLRLGAPYGAGLNPWLVWLQFVPLFSLVWNFHVLKCVTRGIRGWANEKGRDVGDAGLAMGTWACTIACVLTMFFIVPFFVCFAYPALLGTWITYWVKLARITRLMALTTCSCGHQVQPWQARCPECGRPNELVPLPAA